MDKKKIVKLLKISSENDRAFEWNFKGIWKNFSKFLEIQKDNYEFENILRKFYINFGKFFK